MTRKALAVCFKDQPRAAFNSRMLILSVGGYGGRWCAGMRAMRAMRMRACSRDMAASSTARPHVALDLIRPRLWWAAQLRVYTMACWAKAMVWMTAERTKVLQPFGKGMLGRRECANMILPPCCQCDGRNESDVPREA